jgi:hypothetical protein
MPEPYSMMRYDDAGRPFVKEAVNNVDVAKAEATANNLAGFLLLPSFWSTVA